MVCCVALWCGGVCGVVVVGGGGGGCGGGCGGCVELLLLSAGVYSP